MSTHYLTWQHPTDPTNFYENDDAYKSFKLISEPDDNILNDENDNDNDNN